MPTSGVSDPLSRALDDAIAGRRGALFELLARGSHLPGPRTNDSLAEAFALSCRTRAGRADDVALAMARLPADDAPGGSPLEFLPVCGVLALGARAAADPAARSAFVAEIHTHADDLRFRVRDAVVDALGRVGGVAGDELVGETATWMDGYFHAAAVLTAMGRDPWLSRVHDAAGVVGRLGDAFDLARVAPRAAARYPGRKALVEALERAPIPIAMRFGVPVFDILVRWTATDDPELRDVLSAITADKRLGSRFGGEVERVRRALKATRAPPRNPDHDVGPTRDRSGARRKKER
jgi:hypothetical protein